MHLEAPALDLVGQTQERFGFVTRVTPELKTAIPCVLGFFLTKEGDLGCFLEGRSRTVPPWSTFVGIYDVSNRIAILRRYKGGAEPKWIRTDTAPTIIHDGKQILSSPDLIRQVRQTYSR